MIKENSKFWVAFESTVEVSRIFLYLIHFVGKKYVRLIYYLYRTYAKSQNLRP